MSLKMYVLILDRLGAADQAVQAGHALAQFGLEHPKEFAAWQSDSNILVYLGVRNIKQWKTTLEDGEFKHSLFTEPDMIDYWNGDAGVKTAIAVAPNWTCQYLLFKDLPLALQPKPVAPEPTFASEPKKKRWWH